jgi:hypothetical protein
MNNIIFSNSWYFLSDKSLSFDIIFFSILLLLIPIALISGPAVPDILLSLIGLYFLILSIIKKYWFYYKNPIVLGFLFFSTYGIIRSIFSDMPIEALTTEGTIFYFRYIFFAMGVWYLLDKNKYISNCLINVLVITFLVVCVDAIYQYFNDYNFFGFSKYSTYRLTGLFGDEPIVGRYISYLTLFIFALIYQNYKQTKKIIIASVSLLIISEVTVFLSGERSPLFYLILFSIFIIIYNKKYRNYRLISIMISIAIISIISLINTNAKTRIIDLSLSQTSQTNISFLPYSGHHEEHYISALKMFVDKPLFGIGTNLFRFKCENKKYNFRERSCSTHPHQYYIQALAELGIFGFLIISTFFLYLSSFFIRQFIYTFKSNTKRKLSFDHLLYPSILFIYWWPLIPHMSLYNNWNNVLIMLPLGFFMRSIYGNEIK